MRSGSISGAVFRTSWLFNMLVSPKKDGWSAVLLTQQAGTA